MDSKNLFLEPIRLVNQAARKIARIGEGRLRRNTGFGVGQIPVLMALRNGGAMQQVELAHLANIEQPSMAAILKRMERDGLIQRVVNPLDRRSQLIKLTQKALERFGEARAIMIHANKEALAGFSIDEIETLVSLMERLNENLDQSLGRPLSFPYEPPTDEEVPPA